MFNHIRNNIRELAVEVFLSLIVAVLPVSIASFICKFIPISNVVSILISIFKVNVNEWLVSVIFFLLLVIVSYGMILSCFISDHVDQIRAFSNKVDKVILCLADLLLAVLLYSYMVFLPNILGVYKISIFSTAITVISGSIVIPIMRYIANIPTIKVEVLNNRFSYNRNSVLEVNTTDYIDVRAINNNQNPQVIQFLGFCRGKDIDSIAIQKNKSYDFPKNKQGEEYIIPMIETVAPHSVSKKYNNIAISQILELLPERFQESGVHMAAVYKNEDGNFFFRVFKINKS